MDNKKNLDKIQLRDTFATEILDHCDHAVLYEFSTSENRWMNTDIDGPLFIYKRLDDPPLYSLMIISRRSDFVEPITETLNLKRESEQYIYMQQQGEEGQIRGVWLCAPTDRDRVFNTMKMLRDSLKQESSSSLAAGMPMPTSSSSRSRLLLTPKPEQNATTVATNDSAQAGQQHGNMANDDELGKKKMKEVVDVAATEEPIKALQGAQKQQTPMIMTKEPTKKDFQHNDDGPISQESVMTMKVVNIPRTTLSDDEKTPEKGPMRMPHYLLTSTPTTTVSMSSAAAVKKRVESSESTKSSAAMDQMLRNLSPPSPYQQDNDKLLRPVTFGDLERMKRELKEELVAEFRRELGKLRMALSLPDGFGQR